MTSLKLYHFPGACSRVAMTALEQVGVPYEDELVDLMAGAQKRPDYPNPRGKVPALLADGQLLSENGAIQLWLNDRFPEAGLLPKPADDWQRAQQVSDLFWISSVWHPSVRAQAVPSAWTTGEPGPVRERGTLLLNPCMEQLDARLAVSQWWYDQWSITDVYFCWAYSRAERGEYDLSPYPHIQRHQKDVAAVPAYQRALAREVAAADRHAKNAQK